MAKEPEGRVYLVDSTKLAQWVGAAIAKIGGKNKLARALGVSTFTVIRYERGEADRIQEAQIAAIAKFDEVDFRDALNNIEYSGVSPKKDDKLLPITQLANLTQSLGRVSAEVQCLRGEVDDSQRNFFDLVAEMQAISEHLQFLTKKVNSLEDARTNKQTKTQRVKNAVG